MPGFAARKSERAVPDYLIYNTDALRLLIRPATMKKLRASSFPRLLRKGRGAMAL